MTEEYWRPVVGHEGRYEVSNKGRVRSVTRLVSCGNGRQRTVNGRVLALTSVGRGYLQAGIRDEKYRRVGLLVHQMVAAAWLGPCPKGMQVLHGAAGVRDNSASNLSYGTAKDNAADRLRDNTELLGERNPKAKLTAESVTSIRSSLRSVPEIARSYGVSPTTIRDVIHRRTWTHLPAQER